MISEIKRDSIKSSKRETINDIFLGKGRVVGHHLVIQDSKY